MEFAYTVFTDVISSNILQGRIWCRF